MFTQSWREFFGGKTAGAETLPGTAFSLDFLTAHVNLFMSVIASCSLQQENKELKATVAELQSALEAERRRVAALEICLKNAERSRDEAQRRNGELQRDIQQFLLREKAPT